MNLTFLLELTGAILVSLGGGAAIVFALSNFLGRVWAERLMEKEAQEHRIKLADYESRLDAALEKVKSAEARLNYVHSIQFQREFKAYEDMWADVSLVSREFNSAAAVVRDVSAQKPAEIDLEKVTRAITKLVLTIQSHQVFIPESVHRVCISFSGKLMHILLRLADLKGSTDHSSYLTTVLALHNETTSPREEMLKAIRERTGIIRGD